MSTLDLINAHVSKYGQPLEAVEILHNVQSNKTIGILCVTSEVQHSFVIFRHLSLINICRCENKTKTHLICFLSTWISFHLVSNYPSLQDTKYSVRISCDSFFSMIGT